MARGQEPLHHDPMPFRRRTSRILRLNCFVPFLFLATIIVGFLIMMSGSDSYYLKLSTVTGYFLQDDPATNPNGFDYSTSNFGLVNRDYDTDGEYDPEKKQTQWQRFEYQVSKLNKESGSKLKYKVLYMGRHGEGYHNVAEAYYGTPAWDCYWSEKEGNGTITWADAHLTQAGIAQAQKAHDFWSSMLTTQKIPAPESYYTSPLTRCLQTASYTFSGLSLPADRPFAPVIKELLREDIGVHTCDRRSTKSDIREMYPEWTFEEGFAEEDPFWDPVVRESAEAQDARSKVVLDDIFTNNEKTYISISSHSGEISSILRVIGHRNFGLGTGQVIPVLVKAEKVYGTPPATSIPPPTTVSTCTAPPPTSTL